MTTLVWDQAGEKIYQTGVDRGVLYMQDETFAVWNGLTSVEEGSNAELKSYYMDGIKFLEFVTPGDFVGKLHAFTYPDLFERALGIVEEAGLSFYEQPPESFNLTYRTRIGNNQEGIDYGYKIHLLYNLVAVPDSATFNFAKSHRVRMVTNRNSRSYLSSSTNGSSFC